MVRQDYEKLFAYLDSPEVPQGLFERIMIKIYKEEQLRLIKKQLVIFSLGLIVFLVSWAPFTLIFWQEFIQSGFPQFLSLAFSDFSLVVVYWQSFGLAILESLPVTMITLFLFAFLVFFWLLKQLVQIMVAMRKQLKLTNS